MSSLVTFDVFDTLLTRAVGNPTSLFILMGRLDAVAQVTGYSPEGFARLRILAERRARDGRSEVTLDQIYTELGAGLSLPSDSRGRLRDIEILLEHRLSRVIPSSRALLECAAGARRLAVSDMYLPVEVVRGLLEHHALIDLVDDVHVSSESGTTKSSGGMYGRLQRLEHPQSKSWRHHGDNAFSDVRVPKFLGIETQPVTIGRLNRYEEIWDSYRWETEGFSSLVAGASRLARLGFEAPPDRQPIIDVAAGVAGPILMAYVLWVLNSARQEGIRRLYFLARDGEILYLIARRLIARMGIDIELHYLYGSRSVYHRAGLATKDISQARWAWSSMYRLTAMDVLTRLGLPAVDAEKALARLGLTVEGRLTATPRLVERLTNDEGIVRDVHASAKQLLSRVQGYLRQEGMLDGVPYAVVDTGWAGRIAQSLNDVLPADAEPLSRGYLFGHMKREEGFERPDALRGYLFDEWAETGFRGGFNQAYGPLETFTVANHGMTTDFAERDGRVQPVLASDTNPVLASWPWDLFRAVVFRFVDECVLDQDIANSMADLRRPVAAVLTEFWNRPTMDEARVWGAYVYEDDILAQSRNPLADPITVKDFIGKTRASYEGKRLWMSGSVQLSSAAVRPPARLGLWFNDQRRKAERGEELLPERWRGRLRLVGAGLRFRTTAWRAGRLSPGDKTSSSAADQRPTRQ